MSEIKFPDVKVKLVGEDGNIFSILGRVAKALREGGHPEAAKEYQDKVTSSGSYDEALQITMEYVDVE